MKSLIVLVALALAGCGTTQVYHATADRGQQEHDIAECEYEGVRASPNNAIMARNITVRCLKMRGYNW